MRSAIPWLAFVLALDSGPLMDHLAQAGHGVFVNALLRDPGLPAAAAPEAQPKEALDAWWHFFGLLRGEAELAADRDAAQRLLAESADPAVQGQAQQRLIRLTEALGTLRRGEWGDSPSLEAPAGAEIAAASGRATGDTP